MFVVGCILVAGITAFEVYSEMQPVTPNPIIDNLAPYFPTHIR